MFGGSSGGSSGGLFGPPGPPGPPGRSFRLFGSFLLFWCLCELFEFSSVNSASITSSTVRLALSSYSILCRSGSIISSEPGVNVSILSSTKRFPISYCLVDCIFCKSIFPIETIPYFGCTSSCFVDWIFCKPVFPTETIPYFGCTLFIGCKLVFPTETISYFGCTLSLGPSLKTCSFFSSSTGLHPAGGTTFPFTTLEPFGLPLLAWYNSLE